MMRLEDKIGQMFAVGFEGLTAPQYILDWLAEGRIGSVILFARNIDTPAQVAALTASLHLAAKYPILVGIDQEGGTVARLRTGFSESPGAMAMASAIEDTEARIERVSRVLARELKALGINWDYAPVVDISYNADNPSVGTRSFGSDKERVSQLAAAAVRGFQAGGVAACAKHFPGLGNTAIDTHEALPTLDASVDGLLINDLTPYRAVIEAGIESIMTTHTIFNSVDAKHPATLSPVVVHQLLRGILGFDGVVSTDCLEMKAIAHHYSPAETATLAALAGVDMILFSHTRATQEAGYAGLLAAVQSGRVPLEVIDASNARIAAMKQRYTITNVGDIRNIRSAEHLAIMREAARAGVTLLKGTLPLTSDHARVALVEFASVLESGIVESGGQTGLARVMKQRAPEIKTLSLRSVEDGIDQALEITRGSGVLILATRSAHLNIEQHEKAAQLVRAAKKVIHICLRNPYDAVLFPEVDTILCTCGDSTPSLEAAVDALLGDFMPTGQLPVPLPGVKA
jgi:beta-N-acetylhexosaminidase